MRSMPPWPGISTWRSSSRWLKPQAASEEATGQPIADLAGCAPAPSQLVRSRVTPVPQSAVVREPAAGFGGGFRRAAVAEPARRPTAPSPPPCPCQSGVSHAPASRYERVPDVETVDVPERVVALADDLDIPELTSTKTSRRRPPMTILMPSSPAFSTR